MSNKLTQVWWAIYDIIAPDQNFLYEMKNLAPKHTGLDHYIRISARGNAKYGSRVKVSNVPGKFDYDDSFSVSVDHEPVYRTGKVGIRKI